MRDFFEQQSIARRNSLLLILYFLTAVAVVAALVAVAIYVMFSFAPGRLNTSATPFLLSWREWDYGTIGKIAAGVTVLIASGTLYKYLRLRSGGGGMIAEMLGGRLIYPDTDDFHERRLLNIIEEMAIASGVTVPSVYLLADERGINAFAAGFAQEDAVLGVTWGALHYLTREELQGVIAHEFSHILSGDMLINIRLQGLLHGILVIGLLGQSILRGSFRAGGGRSRDNAGVAGIGIGLVLLILGYAGVFVGKLIKSAISRQREFLADASAVQFTRNPMGLAGALKKIGGLVDGSRMTSPQAAEISHMYFGNGMAESWFSAFSTHPPLLERVRRLDPEFQGAFPERIEQVAIDREEALIYASEGGLPAGKASAGEMPAPARPATEPPLVAAEDLRQAVSGPTPVQADMARELIASLPPPVRRSVRSAFGARAVMYGLLLDKKQDIRQRQLAALKEDADPQVWQEFCRLLPDIVVLPPELRLPLVDLAVPALKTLSPEQYLVFRRNMKTLMESDGRIDLFEYTLQFILRKHLQARFGKARQRLVRIKSTARVRDEISIVLSFLARYGNDNEGAAGKAMMRAIRKFDDQDLKYLSYLPAADATLKDFDRALKQLNGTGAPIKQKLLDAALECITWDKKITARESELFRVITEALDCPVPPWLTLEGMK